MVTKDELKNRRHKLFAALGNDWDTVFIINKVNQYYLTGTFQDGLLVMKNCGDILFFVRRSFERAKAESPLDNIYPMTSYKDASAVIGKNCGRTFLETETVTISIMQRLKKHFVFDSVISIEQPMARARSVKSQYELKLLEQAGSLHNDFLVNDVPALIKEGLSEAEFSGILYKEMLKAGHNGFLRFGMFQTEMLFGQIAFGENSLYPTNFDGPGGMRGMNPAIPSVGSNDRLLKKGDLIFLDFAFNIEGYHTDKTQIYMYGANPTAYVSNVHRECLKVQSDTAKMLKAGNTPANIYKAITESLDKDFLSGFMGTSRFLGHGIGLHVDEFPAIAAGFNEPLQENTAIALEPKKGIEGVGLVGAEDTYIVTSSGGRCITGGGRDIIVVP
ncbi:MAG: Xaa-Pro peptidase family protein [Firmicutes bacterium]|nr:Xaa-Pro peptidase family protein [Bacillota bacterium]